MYRCQKQQSQSKGQRGVSPPSSPIPSSSSLYISQPSSVVRRGRVPLESLNVASSSASLCVRLAFIFELGLAGLSSLNRLEVILDEESTIVSGGGRFLPVDVDFDELV